MDPVDPVVCQSFMSHRLLAAVLELRDIGNANLLPSGMPTIAHRSLARPSLRLFEPISGFKGLSPLLGGTCRWPSPLGSLGGRCGVEFEAYAEWRTRRKRE